MALELLFPHFDELIRTPEDVQRLNEAILQLAVQGKLVAQDPNDEPASELLKRMQAERAEKEKTGRIKVRRASVLISEGVPYELPKGWIWTCFSTVADFVVGRTPPTKQVQYWDDNGAPWVSISDMSHYGLVNTTERKISDQAISDFMAGKRAPKGTLLMSFKLTVGKVALLGFDAFHNEAIISIFPFYGIEQPYLYWFLPIFALGGRTKGAIKGATLNSESLADLMIPLPPLAEQHRIVAKVDELFAQTRALEARLRQAQADVVTVNRAALHRLHTAQDDDQFQAAWRTLRDHFDVLYDDPRNVAELRQTILDLAVRGKLVAQDPRDEPTEELLKRIEAERNAIGARTRKSTVSSPIDAKAQPFRLPSGWAWTKLDDIASSVDYGSSVKADKNFGDVPILRMNNIVRGQIVFDSVKYVAREIDDLPRLFLRYNDLLFNRTNSYELVGKTGIYKGQDDEYTFASYLIRISLFAQEIEPDYVNSYFNTSICRSCQIEPRITQQTGQANFSGAKLKDVLVPLPPFAEQQRIVAKVDQLMRLCDELEAEVVRTETHNRKLTEAILQLL